MLSSYSYLCSVCGLTNSLLNKTCADRKCNTPNQIELTDLERFEILHIGIFTPYAERRLIKPMAESKAELHSKFFADEKFLIKDKPIEELIVHLEELETIILEARARASATDDEIRQKRAKLSKDDRDKLITNPDYAGSDAITNINKRKDRISKVDKLKDSLLGLGLDPETMKGLMSNVKIGDGSNPEKASTKGLGFTFNAEKQPKPVEITIEEPSEPFDPTNLFGN